ncbi:3413_t:CDS:10 [Entrophospora sp. SA101]|nr:3413_t:CDS:10 [Entrophospora sp. SA101]
MGVPKKAKLSKKAKKGSDDDSYQEETNDFLSGDDNKKKVKKLKKDNNDAEKDVKPEQKKLSGHLNRPGPSALGSKELPEGEENCLQLSSITREKAQDLVKQHGGRVTTSISKKTSFVVVGEDAGPAKLEKIKTLKIPTLDEDGLFNLIRESPGNPEPSYAESSTKVSSSRKGKAAVKFVQEPIGQSSSSETTDSKHLIWADRYRPTSLEELCGNNTSIKTLKTWLHDWETNFKLGFKCKTNGKYPAVLISGPPGIGKTTAAHLVGKHEGYDIKEFNASDVRNKKTLNLTIRIATGNMSIASFYNSNDTNDATVTASSSSKNKKGKAKEEPKPPHTNRTLIIMDEVDGMSSGDRGGAQDENLKINGNVVDEIIKGTTTDIRQVMNLLSCWKLSEDSIDYNQGKQLIKNSEKDIVLNIWDVAVKLLDPVTWSSRNEVSLNEKLNLYFHDPDLTPLMIQVFSVFFSRDVASKEFIDKNKDKNVDPELLEEFAVINSLSKAASFISEGDLIGGMIHGSQQRWSLMPFHGMASTVIPSYYSCGRGGGLYQFPSWLGQNSKALKHKKILKSIQSKLRLKCNANKDEIILDYIPALLTKIYYPLIGDNEDIQKVIDCLDEYNLTKEDWESIIRLDNKLPKELAATQQIELSIKCVKPLSASDFLLLYIQHENKDFYLSDREKISVNSGSNNDNDNDNENI